MKTDDAQAQIMIPWTLQNSLITSYRQHSFFILHSAYSMAFFHSKPFIDFLIEMRKYSVANIYSTSISPSHLPAVRIEIYMMHESEKFQPNFFNNVDHCRTLYVLLVPVFNSDRKISTENASNIGRYKLN